jgi:hypothetical protein
LPIGWHQSFFTSAKLTIQEKYCFLSVFERFLSLFNSFCLFLAKKTDFYQTKKDENNDNIKNEKNRRFLMFFSNF